MKESPLVSIIMGIYNCELTLDESINSILDQSYYNWELIICDDCSTDNTYNIAKKYEVVYPKKIKLIKNESNMGLAGSLNHCLKYVKGDFIARQDGDDKSVIDRIEKQIDFLTNNINYDLVGTTMISFNNNKVGGVRGVSRLEPDMNKLAVSPPFCHATIMARSHVYRKLQGYRVTKYTRRCEDVDLWFRFFKEGFKGYNLDEPLYMVRDDEGSYKRRNFKSYFYATKVCFDGYRLLKLPLKSYVYLLKPVIAAFVPTSIKKEFHKSEIKEN